MSDAVEVRRFEFVASGHGSVVAAYRQIQSAEQRTAKAAAEGARQASKAHGDAAKSTWEAELELVVKRAQAQRQARQAAVKAAQQQREAVARGTREVRAFYDRQTEAAQRAAAAQIAVARRAADESSRAFRMKWDAAASAVRGIGVRAVQAALGAGSLALGTVGAAARESVSLNDVARRLAISARGAGQTLVDPYALQREFENTALATPGIASTDVAEGTQLYVTKTGDLDTARANQRGWATIANASGSSYADIAGTAADLAQKFDIKTVEEMQQAFATLHFQGKKGAFELRDAARYFGEMSAAAQRFGVGSGPKALATLGGLAQIARTANASGAETSTSIQNMFGQLVAKSGELKSKYGVRVFDEEGGARDIRDILVELIGSVGGGDLEKKKAGIQKIFGLEGMRAVSPLLSTFSKAAMSTQGDEQKRVAEGMRAVRAAIDDAIDAPGTWADVVEDNAHAQKSTSAQLTAAWEQLEAKTTAELTPALIALVPKLAKFVDLMDPAVTVLRALIDTMEALVDFMVDKGWIKKKPQTLAEAEQALKDFDEAHAYALDRGDLTPEDYAKRRRLEAEYDAAYNRTYETAPTRRSMSQDEFVQEFVARREQGGFLGGVFNATEEDERLRAIAVYRGLMEDPNATRGKAETFGSLFGTDSQLKLVRDTAEMVTSNMTRRPDPTVLGQTGPGDAMNEETGESVKVLRSALGEAAEAAMRFRERLDAAEPRPGITGDYIR